MTEDQFACVDSLSDAVKSIQNCLQCTICLDMISSPVKTRCGHSFCRTCIGTVLSKKNSKCPLCNTNLQRRSVSKDVHMKRCISGLEQIVRAIRADINIDILAHTKNPGNTKEGYPSPRVRCFDGTSAKIVEKRKSGSEKISSFLERRRRSGEQSAGSSNRDILDETRATCSEYKKDNAIRKDDSAERRRNERVQSSNDGLSGVYPLLSSPREERSNDEIISTKEKRIKNWLETLPDSELLENPSPSHQALVTCLDDTTTVASGNSSMFSFSDTKREKGERLTERDNVQKLASDSMKEQHQRTHSKASSREGNNTRGKNKRRTATRSFPERGIKADSTERKLKYQTIHAKTRERFSKSARISSDSLISSTDAADSSKHLAGPGNTTKETWNRVVQFGKEMRTRRGKLKSLDVSVQSTSGSRPYEEYLSSKKKWNASVTNIRNFREQSETIEGLNESIEDTNEHRVPRHKSPLEDQKEAQDTSYISLEREGRVPIMSLRPEQMNDIIGVMSNADTDMDHQESKGNPSEDHGTVPKKRLSLRKGSNSSKNSTGTNFSSIDLSPPKITPVKVNLEERYDILRGSPPTLLPEKERTPIKFLDNQPRSASKLSLKKNPQSCGKSSEFPTTRSSLSSVKCNLTEQINQSEAAGRKIAGGSLKNSENSEKLTNRVSFTQNSEKTCVVPFSKLGKVFRKRRKVKFYKLGSLKHESTARTLSSRISDASGMNLITYLTSEDTLEAYKTSEEVCNLENRMSSTTVNPLEDVKDRPSEATTLEKSLAKSQDSLGVLLVTLKNQEEKEKEESRKKNDCGEQQREFGESRKTGNVSASSTKLAILDKNGTRKKPVIRSVVKMMSPDMDSQLKLLELDSPMEMIPNNQRIQQETKSEVNRSDRKRKQFADKESIDNLNGIRLNIKQDLVRQESIKDFTQIHISNSNMLDSKKKYKRIVVTTSDSDTESSKRIKDKASKIETTKRKRMGSNDSDDDILVNEIVNNWCNGLDISKRSVKKGKLDENKGTILRRINTTIPRSMDFDAWSNGVSNNEAMISNNDIIDKVRSFQTNERENENKNKKRIDGDSVEVEIITESIGTQFFSGKIEKNRGPLATASFVETNDLFAESNKDNREENLDGEEEDFEVTLIENLNGSNKENDFKKENVRHTGRCEIGGLTTERGQDKPFEVENHEDPKNKSALQPKENSDEYNSLMDVTQDQLLLKALEEELFSTANCRGLEKSTKTTSQERRLESESRKKMNLGNKDTGSSDEDEIIENTPQSQTKFMDVDRSIDSRARKCLSMSQVTPASKKNFGKAMTTTSTTLLAGKLRTPINQNTIRPLYQSTPKLVQGTAQSRGKGLAKFVESETKLEQVKSESAERTRDKRQLCFVWSSLNVVQVESIKRLAVLIGATCTQNFTTGVTHVIVATDEKNAATKTLKFLQGIAYRKFVVGFKWVEDSLKEGSLVNEESYEAVDCYTFEAGPRKSRLRQSNLFEGFVFLCVEPFQNITVTQCQDLLEAMGSTIVRSMDVLGSIQDKYKVILLQNEAHKDEVVANWYKKTKAIPVSCDWIVECISQYKLVSCYMYLHEIVPEDVLKLGYPEEMIVPEEFDSTCDTSAGH